MAGRWISRCAKTAGSLAGSHFNCHQCAYQAAQERCKQRRREPQNLCGCSHGIASHQPGIVGLQQIGRRIHGPHAGIEPQVVDICIEDHGHPVVDV
jgi:hypothetical protein